MTDPETTRWLADQQRLHNLNTYRWRARPTPKRFKFTDQQMAIAIASLDKKAAT